MPTIQNTPNGKILVTSNSFKVAGSCCCSGVQPSSCPNEDPEMYLTVFDADYSGSDITWCGETWTPAEVQANTEKGPVCPTSYTKNSSTFFYNYRTHDWHYKFTELRLRRRLSRSTGGTYRYRQSTVRFRANHTGTTADDFAVSTRFTSAGAGPFSNTDSNLHFISTAPGFATINSWYITDEFFGESTVNGIRYGWRRGNGW